MIARKPGLVASLCLVALASCVTPAERIEPSAGVRADGAAYSARASREASGAPAPSAARAVVGYRRLTESQYRNTIVDVFGPNIKINARFEPERREDGLQAVGSARLSITTGGLEQYLAVARSIADQVMDGSQRATNVACDASDRACAEKMIATVGEQLFRRPLTESEKAQRLGIWSDAFQNAASGEKALKQALVSLLIAPEFLFRVEVAEPDPDRPGGYRLDAQTKASRVAFLLWDSGPDAELREAARTGGLHDPGQLARQVTRLAASPRFKSGVRALFSDMLQFDRYGTLTKDPATYPNFSQAVADSSREETLRFLVDHLVDRGLDYRDIFTSRDTFLNRSLAAVYNVPYASSQPWTRYAFNEESERSGILTQLSFLALSSHPASSSPTVRGVKLHEIFLCLPTPEPPPDVDFSKVQATENGTVRTRLVAHMTNPGCNVCHAMSDPAGLTLEHFDGLGQTRLMENGAPIDVGAVIDGKPVNGARGLGQYLHDSPLATTCVVRNVYYSGVGRPFDYKDSDFLKGKAKAFADSGFRLGSLYVAMLSDPDFYRIAIPERPPTSAGGKAATAIEGGEH